MKGRARGAGRGKGKGPIRCANIYKPWDHNERIGESAYSPTKGEVRADCHWSMAGAFFQEASGKFRKFTFTIGIIPQYDEAMRACLKRLKQVIGAMRNWGVLHHAIPKGGGKSFIIKDEFLDHEKILEVDPSRASEVFEELAS